MDAPLLSVVGRRGGWREEATRPSLAPGPPQVLLGAAEQAGHGGGRVGNAGGAERGPRRARLARVRICRPGLPRPGAAEDQGAERTHATQARGCPPARETGG